MSIIHIVSFIVGTILFALLSYYTEYLVGKWKVLPGIVRKRINETRKMFLANIFYSILLNVFSFTVIINLRPTLFKVLSFGILLLPVMIFVNMCNSRYNIRTWMTQKYSFINDLVSSISISIQSLIYFIVLYLLFSFLRI